MASFEIPNVVTPRLKLRAFCAEDLEPYARMQADIEVMRHLTNGRTSSRAEAWRNMMIFVGGWALRGYGMWACEKADDGAFMGSVGVFHPLDWPEPEIAYAFDQPFWGKGFATEAARAARDWLFAHSTLARVASFIKPGNHSSKKVVGRLGAAYEGVVDIRGEAYEHWVHRRP